MLVFGIIPRDAQEVGGGDVIVGRRLDYRIHQSRHGEDADVIIKVVGEKIPVKPRLQDPMKGFRKEVKNKRDSS
jgi:hypothetical protein